MLYYTSRKYTTTHTEAGDLLVAIELPGVSKENLGVTSKDNEIIISYTYDDEKTEYQKSAYIDKDYDADSTTATLKNGVLKLTIPKRKQPTRNKITIN